MSTLQAPPEKPQPPRNEWPRWTDDAVDRKQRIWSISISLAVTIIFHLVFIGLIPWDQIAVIEKEKPKPNPPLEVEFLPPPPPPPPEFVEANPNAPEEKPEDTQKISFQDQVAAQEVPDETSDADAPKVEGETLESSKIVEGDITAETGPTAPAIMSEPSPPTPPTPEQEQAEPTDAQPQEQQAEQTQPTETQDPAEETTEATEQQMIDAEISEQEPVMDDVKAIEVEEAPTEEEGFMAAVETGEAETQVEETKEEVAQPERGEQKEIEVYMEEVAVSAADAQQSNEPRPQARPRLNFVRTTSGPLKNNPRSTNRMGSVAVDANFDKFGAYLQRMVEAIDLQWQLLARQSSTIMSEMGSRVVVRYQINDKGEIINMEVLFSSASRSGTTMCLNAIESRSPFGVWTEEMARTLGDSQTITFTFYYR